MLKDRRRKITDKIAERCEYGHQTGCLNWTGSTSGNGRGGGYPRMCLDGQTVAVYKVVFTHNYGYIPGKKQIDCQCNNRLCINPGHLRMMTHKQNQKRRRKNEQ